LSAEAFAEDELVLVAGPRHPLALKKRAIAAKQLIGVPMILREPGSGTRAQVLDDLAAMGIEPRIVLSLPSGEGIVRAVARGIGVAFLSRLVVADAIAAGRVVRVRLRDLTLARTFRIVRPRLETPSPAALAFMAIARTRS
jgi:DNA-binding transcriptional LysR family regulator